MSQIALPLHWPEPVDDEFLVSGSNARVIEQLEHWGRWQVMAALLVGPRKSGRSLLGRIFAGRTGGGLVDDADLGEEEAVFHAWNRAQADRRPLLIVAGAAPPEWSVRLPDLRSRLAASPVLRIGSPDDDLIGRLIARALERRGLAVRPGVIDWLAVRIERSHVAVARAVDLLDATATAHRKPLSVALARLALEQAGLLAERSPPPGIDD